MKLRVEGASRQGSSYKYRADIDGLRAVAVLAVVAFHTFPEWVRGGFIGVDIFFVISGYLISSILFTEMEGVRFRYSVFYARRIKRIFPALIVVLIACLGIGWAILFDGEYSRLGQHIVSGVSFTSNFQLWKESGYFDADATTKPLLHLWSLGIEEQFYIFWPLLLGLASRLGNRFLVATLLIMGASFISSLVSPQFYSPLSRFWELMIGGLLAYRGIRRPREWKSAAGLLLLVAGFLIIHGDLAVHGWWALLPTVGTYLIIAAGPDTWINRRILGYPVLVDIGLISYPLYLWHWPLISFAHILEGGNPPWAIRLMAALIAFPIAWLTYQLVEKPIRFGQRKLVPALCFAMLLVGSAGLVLRADGLKFRSVVQSIEPPFSSGLAGGDEGNLEPGCGTSEAFGRCVKDKRGPATVALLGDSKAAALVDGLVRASDAHTRVLFVGGNGPIGIPLPVISDDKLYAPFQTPIRIASDAIANNPAIEIVVLTTAARALFMLTRDDTIEDLPESPNYDVALEGLDNLVTKLVGAGKKIVITVDNPTLPDPVRCVPRVTGIDWLTHYRGKRCTIGYDEQLRLSKKYRDLLAAVQRRHQNDVRIFDPTELLCDMTMRICTFQKNGHLLYSYSDHVSDYAAGLIGEALVPFLNAPSLRASPSHASFRTH